MSRDTQRESKIASNFGKLVLLLGVSASGLATAPAFAQSAATPEVERGRVGDIVVTARKREESLLKVPGAITAITADSMETKGITDLTKVIDYTPSLNLVSNNGGVSSRATSTLSIRGISGGATNGASKGVSLFIDGSPAGSGIFDTLDNIERVEVLKGPQATYFGRATFAGAVNLVTKVPKDVFEGSVEGMTGNDSLRELKASLTGPIIPGKLGFSVGMRDYSYAGGYDNVAADDVGGGQYDKLGSQSTKSISAGLYASPFANFTMKANGSYWENSDGPSAFGQYRQRDFTCNTAATPGPNNYICGTLPEFNLSRLASVTAVDALFTNLVLNDSTRIQARVFDDNDPYIDHGGLELEGWHLGGQANLEIPSLGVTATLLGSANSIHSNAIYDFALRTIAEAGPNPNFPANPNVERYNTALTYWQRRAEDKSAEFRLTSDQDQRLRWVTGVSYVYVLNQQSTASLNVTGTSSFTRGSPSKVNTSGVFAGVSFDILEDLTLDLEGRYQWDKIQAFNRPTTPVVYPPTTALVAEETYKNFVPRVNLSYRFSPDTMVYAVYSKGLNPGQFNTSVLSLTPAQITYLAGIGGGTGVVVRPETMTNYEGGLKTKFWDGRGTLTAAVYFAELVDQAVTNTVNVPRADGSFQVASLIQNIGRSDIKGLELEGIVALTDNLTVNGGIGYNGTETKASVCLNCPTTTVTGEVFRWNGNIGIEYKRPLTNTLDWFARSDTVARSHIYDSVAKVLETPNAYRTNFRVGVSGARYKFEAFVLNAFDDLTPSALEVNGDGLNFALRNINVTLPTRRQYGARIGYKF